MQEGKIYQNACQLLQIFLIQFNKEESCMNELFNNKSFFRNLITIASKNETELENIKKNYKEIKHSLINIQNETFNNNEQININGFSFLINYMAKHMKTNFVQLYSYKLFHQRRTKLMKAQIYELLNDENINENFTVTDRKKLSNFLSIKFSDKIWNAIKNMNDDFNSILKEKKFQDQLKQYNCNINIIKNKNLNEKLKKLFSTHYKYVNIKGKTFPYERTKKNNRILNQQYLPPYFFYILTETERMNDEAQSKFKENQEEREKQNELYKQK